MSRHASRMTIDLGALAANYNLIRKQVGANIAVAGVVKANAYGTGVEQAVRTLESNSCPWFFVATLEEALQVRKLTDKPVAVLGGLYRGAEDDYRAHRITPVLNTTDEILRCDLEGPSIWHVDTGMNRLGLDIKELPDVLSKTDKRPSIVMSHFACSDEAGHPLNDLQAQRFHEAASLLPQATKCLANSSGIFRNPGWHHDMVRPGMALYGLNPTPETGNPMHPVVQLDARLLQIREGREGETVGYSATYTIPRPTRIGVVGFGYADGFIRSGSGKAALYWQGKRCPVLGRVSMDLIAVDLGEAPGANPGDWLEVIGPNQSPDDLATACGTIGYEILTSLSRRSERVYKTA